MQIKALQAIAIRNPVTGELMSIAYGTVADVPDGLGNMLIDDGIAEAYSGGGGGSSDFSTAKVTIINSNTEAQTYAHADDFPHIITTRTGETFLGTAGEDVYDQDEFTIVLYEGGCELDLSECDETVAPIVIGDVSSDDLNFWVTGDCTITVKGTGKHAIV